MKISKLAIAISFVFVTGCSSWSDNLSVNGNTTDQSESLKQVHEKSENKAPTVAEIAKMQGHGGFLSEKDPRSHIKDAKVLENLEAWQDLKFGFFVHWNATSVVGMRPSWTLNEINPRGWDYGRSETQLWQDAGKDLDTYRTMHWDLNRQFNPTKFDPKEWTKLAKSAGTKYFVFTTKHHDGFSMFDTQLSDYKVTGPSTPYSKNKNANITKVLFDEFRDEGFKIGAYFSKADWHNNDFWVKGRPSPDRNPNYDVQQEPERWARFKDFTQGQLNELVTDYGKIDVLWFDSGWVDKKNGWDVGMDEVRENARKHQPGIIMVDRRVYGRNENYLTPEQQIPDEFIPYPWETNMTTTKSWTWTPHDEYKSAREIIHYLTHVVAMGGNYLLNVGPDATGSFDPRAIALFKDIGKWMDVNGEAIYATRPVAPYKKGKLRYSRSKDSQRINAIYLADIGETLPTTLTIDVEDAAKVKRVELLGSNAKPSFTVLSDNTLQVNLPQKLELSAEQQAWTLSLYK